MRRHGGERGRHEREPLLLTVRGKDGMKIICLGDSLTAGYRVPEDARWVTLLQNETPHTWQSAGVCGDTSAGMLVRLQTEVLPQRPDAVLLLGGGNDIALTGGFDQAKLNLAAMAHQCVACAARPVVCVPPPIRGIPEAWRLIPDWQGAHAASLRYAAWLTAFAKAFGLRMIDFAAAIEAGGGESLYQPDGLHPNVAGNRVMADAVKRSGLFH